MRGDWIHDWVQVEMEYRAGPLRPHHRRRRPVPRHWAAPWASLFKNHRAPTRPGSPVTGC